MKAENESLQIITKGLKQHDEDGTDETFVSWLNMYFQNLLKQLVQTMYDRTVNWLLMLIWENEATGEDEETGEDEKADDKEV